MEFCMVLYILSSSQALLSALSWCSACTSGSEGVFLMYPQREMYSTSSYSSVILLSPRVLNLSSDSSNFCVIYKSGSAACFVSCSILLCLFIHLLFLLLLLKVGHLIVVTEVAQIVKNLPAVWETGFSPWVGKIPRRREWLPTPVFLPRESHGQRGLVGYSPQSC